MIRTIALSILIAACGSPSSTDLLVGTWKTSYANDSRGFTGDDTLTFKADHSMSLTSAYRDSSTGCNVADDGEGWQWAATDEDLILSPGTPTEEIHGCAIPSNNKGLHPVTGLSTITVAYTVNTDVLVYGTATYVRQ